MERMTFDQELLFHMEFLSLHPALKEPTLLSKDISKGMQKLRKNSLLRQKNI